MQGRIGRVENGKINFEDEDDVRLVDEAFGFSGAYSLIDDKITVDQLTKGIDLNDIDKSGASNVQNAGKILKLEPEKDGSGERYFRFNNRITSIYLQIDSSKIYDDDGKAYWPDDLLGEIKKNKIELRNALLLDVKKIIDRQFGDGAYDNLDENYYTIEQLTRGIDLTGIDGFNSGTTEVK